MGRKAKPADSVANDRLGHQVGRNLALRQAPDLMLANAVCCLGIPWLGLQMQFDRMKRREFIAFVGGA
jgi:hypothetical protein